MLSYLRNYEDNPKGTTKSLQRNFLYGHIIPQFQSELKILEKIISQRKIHICIGTWNMNGKKPLNDLIQFILPDGFPTVADIIIIGTQETFMYNIDEFENTIVNIVGSTHVIKAKRIFGRLRLILFLRRELILFSSTFEIHTILSNKYTIFKTKGALSLGFIIFGVSFLFVMVHLSAHSKNKNKRIQEVNKIIHTLDELKKLPINHKFKDTTANFDTIFFFGDLNFRLDSSKNEILNWINNTHFSKTNPVVLKNDQLKTLLDNEIFLQHFIEAPITFPPTYKYSHGSQELDSDSKWRTPSYTDRILYKCNKIFFEIDDDKKNVYMHNKKINCIIYDSARTICSSDHKPVFGIYAVNI